MKNIIYRFTAVFFLFIMLSSCEDFLKEEPKSFFSPDIINTEEGAIAYVDGIYRRLSVDGNAFYRHSAAWYSELGTDIAKAILLAQYPGNNTYTVTPEDNKIGIIWRGFYQAINSCNTVITSLPNADLNEDLEANLVAQARTLRAFSYFMLVRFFGDIPLLLEPLESLDISKSSVADIYTEIEKDLKLAIEGGGLPVKYIGEPAGKVTLGAAKMMLAKVYMTMAGWPLKLDKSANYTKAKELLLDLKENPEYGYGLNQKGEGAYDGYGECFNLYKKHTKESIFDIQSSPTTLEDGGIGDVLWSQLIGVKGTQGRNQTNTSICGAFWISATQSLYKLYAKGEDSRFDWNMADYMVGTGGKRIPLKLNPDGTGQWDFLGCAKYRYLKDPWDYVSAYPFSKWQTTPMNFPVYRFADVLLMLAEIENELSSGPTPLALECINAVRNRARGSNDDTKTPNFKVITAGNYDKDSFFNLIIDERARELCFEGHRFFDLTRTEMLVAKFKSAHGITITEDVIYYPIPQADININPNLGN